MTNVNLFAIIFIDNTITTLIDNPKLNITLSRSSTFCSLYGTHASLNRTHTHNKKIMSNPKTKALSLASKKSLGSNMRVAYIEKDSQLVNLAVTSSINSHSWRKLASYESFKRNVYSLATARTVVDLISMVSNVLPQDTGAAFQEAQSAAKMVMDNAILVSNLEPLVFLTLVGKVANIKDAIDLKSRPEDISFLRFNCVVNGAAIDSRVITVNPLSFQFSPKLPQYIYDITAYTATPVVKCVILLYLIMLLNL